MKRAASLLLFALALLSGCATTGEHRLTSVDDFKAKLPFIIHVSGDSMLPQLRHGDLVLVEAKPLTEVKAGDVIVYWPKWSHTPVAHSALYPFKSMWKAKGLHNWDEDPGYVCQYCYIGVARKISNDEANQLVAGNSTQKGGAL